MVELPNLLIRFLFPFSALPDPQSISYCSYQVKSIAPKTSLLVTPGPAMFGLQTQIPGIVNSSQIFSAIYPVQGTLTSPTEPSPYALQIFVMIVSYQDVLTVVCLCQNPVDLFIIPNKDLNGIPQPHDKLCLPCLSPIFLHVLNSMF